MQHPCSPFLVALASVCALSFAAHAQTGYSISGGLSNFDCGNHCDDPCDEFEIEIEGIHPEDVTGCYRNGNYGSPRVLLSSDGTFTVIDYRNPSHLTAVGAIEHFGVQLRGLNASNAIRVRWMRNGAPATVNGSVPIPGGGSAPATQPMLPSIAADMTTASTGGDGIAFSVTNNDPAQFIWIKRRARIMAGVNVPLDALMTGDPVVTQSVPIDNAPFLLGPGQTATMVSDLVEVEDNQSAVFAAQYFQDLGNVGPFNNTHTLGPELGNVMTAAIASPGTGCEFSSPVIIVQPQSVNAAQGRSVDLRVDADGNDMTLSYQWMKDGQELINNSQFSGVTSDGLSIDSLDASTEGFYAVRISNSCGTILSDSALVFITGHNYIAAPVGATATPAAQTIFPGASIYLSGSGALVPPGTTFHWKHNGVLINEGAQGASNGGGDVTGAAGLVSNLPVDLVIDNAHISDGGEYVLVFSNPSGTASSSPVTVTVSDQCGPVFAAQPASFTTCSAGIGYFAVSATGAGTLNYEWQIENAPGVWSPLGDIPVDVSCESGGGSLAFAVPANSPEVLVGVGTCAGSFNVRCVASDDCGATISDPATLTVCLADFNCDGGVDGADVETFFTSWETGDTTADLNADGGVDGGDVEFFFTRWGGGC